MFPRRDILVALVSKSAQDLLLCHVFDVFVNLDSSIGHCFSFAAVLVLVRRRSYAIGPGPHALTFDAFIFVSNFVTGGMLAYLR